MKHAALQSVGANEILSLHVSHSNLKHHAGQVRFNLHVRNPSNQIQLLFICFCLIKERTKKRKSRHLFVQICNGILLPQRTVVLNAEMVDLWKSWMFSCIGCQTSQYIAMVTSKYVMRPAITRTFTDFRGQCITA